MKVVDVDKYINQSTFLHAASYKIIISFVLMEVELMLIVRDVTHNCKQPN